nr:hypothetical protein [uncultured Desulfobacter sp.]
MKKLLAFSACLTVLSIAGCNNINLSAGGSGSVLDSFANNVVNHKVFTFQVTGKGLEPENVLTKGEAILMAERAAIADGYRQLVERVRGVYVDAYTKAGRGSVNQDAILVKTQAWLRGTEVMEITRADNGITEARLRLRVNFSKRGVVWWPVGIADNS